MKQRVWNTLACFFFIIGCIVFHQEWSFAKEQGVAQGARTLTLPVFAIDADEGFSVLLKKMRGKKAILLGDGSHGTKEFYNFRKRVTKKLIAEHGVRVWVLEAEWDSAFVVDQYIRGLLPDHLGPEQMLLLAFDRWPEWVWANEELVEFVLWLKKYNHEKKDSEKVRCFGMDMQMAVRSSLEYLADKFTADPDLKAKYEDLVLWWEPYADDPVLLSKAYYSGTETGSLQATELLLAIPNPEPTVARVLKMLISVEAYYRAMSYEGYAAWNHRSLYFSDFVLDLLALKQSANGIVAWAHNSHVSDMRGTDTGEYTMQSFGGLMRKALGGEGVFALGSAGYSGTVMAAAEWGETPASVVVPPAHASSLEAFINSGGWENPLLLFENEDQRRLWSVLMAHRGIGVVYDPEDEYPGNYLKSPLGARYDALVFWQKTTALQGLEKP